MLNSIFSAFFWSFFLVGANTSTQASFARPIQPETSFTTKEKNKTEDYFEKSLEVANLIEDKGRRSDILIVIATRLVKCTHNYEKAIEIALSIPSEERRTNSLNRVAFALAEKGLLKKALETVLMGTNVEERFYGLCEISANLKDKEVKSKFNNMIVEYTLKNLKQETDLYSADNCIEQVARYLTDQGECEQALRVADSFYDKRKKNYLLHCVAIAYSRRGHFDKALEVASTIVEVRDRDGAFDLISEELIFKLNQEEISSETENEELDFTDFAELVFKNKVSHALKN